MPITNVKTARSRALENIRTAEEETMTDAAALPVLARAAVFLLLDVAESFSAIVAALERQAREHETNNQMLQKELDRQAAAVLWGERPPARRRRKTRRASAKRGGRR